MSLNSERNSAHIKSCVRLLTLRRSPTCEIDENVRKRYPVVGTSSEDIQVNESQFLQLHRPKDDMHREAKKQKLS